MPFLSGNVAFLHLDWHSKVGGGIQCRTLGAKTIKGAPGFFLTPSPVLLWSFCDKSACAKKSRDFLAHTVFEQNDHKSTGEGVKKKSGRPFVRLSSKSSTLNTTTHLAVPIQMQKGIISRCKKASFLLTVQSVGVCMHKFICVLQILDKFMSLSQHKLYLLVCFFWVFPNVICNKLKLNIKMKQRENNTHKHQYLGISCPSADPMVTTASRRVATDTRSWFLQASASCRCFL